MFKITSYSSGTVVQTRDLERNISNTTGDAIFNNR